MGPAMGLGQVASGVMGIFGSMEESKGIEAQARHERRMSEINAQFAEMQARDAIRRGGKKVQNLNRQVAQLVGEQRAATAAQGVQLDTGSAADILESTKEMEAIDVTTIENNAWREAWGYKFQAQDIRGAANMNEIARKYQAKSTLLAGGMKAAGSIMGGLHGLSGTDFGGMSKAVKGLFGGGKTSLTQHPYEPKMEGF